MSGRPKTASSLAQQEMDKVESQFKEFDDQVQKMTVDNMNKAPKPDVEPQTKMSSREIDKSQDMYLKPHRQVASAEKFNEAYREDYNYKTEYVKFIAENNEIKGETIELWTKPFPGMPCQFWKVPVNKPVWGPRHLAEQLTKCCYHRLVMQENTRVGADGHGTYYGQMAADTTIDRLVAKPVSTNKSIFMGANTFS
jgi:hypothetical protein